MGSKLDALKALAERARDDAMDAESWEWRQSYEIGEGEFHWCLVDPDGDTNRTLDLFTITHTTATRSISGHAFNEAPVPAFIESADPSTMIALIASCEELAAVVLNSQNALRDYVDRFEKAGDIMGYGRSVIADNEAALTRHAERWGAEAAAKGIGGAK